MKAFDGDPWEMPSPHLDLLEAVMAIPHWATRVKIRTTANFVYFEFTGREADDMYADMYAELKVPK